MIPNLTDIKAGIGVLTRSSDGTINRYPDDTTT